MICVRRESEIMGRMFEEAFLVLQNGLKHSKDYTLGILLGMNKEWFVILKLNLIILNFIIV